MAKEKVTFTNESLRLMTCEPDPKKKRSIYYDKKQPKLACLVSVNKVKTFALHAYDKIRKKPIQHTIGRYPDISINTAREIAAKLLVQIAEGVDIKEAARAIRQEQTVDDLFNNWLVHAKVRLRTWTDSERSYNIHIKPTFGNKRISSVTQEMVKMWHYSLINTPRKRLLNGKSSNLTKATANRCLALLRSIFNEEASQIENPCSKVKAYKEISRDRFLLPDELKRFFCALDDENTSEDIRDIVYFSLFTGARRSNIFSMAWVEIDFSSSTWTIPADKSKNKDSMKIPLISQAMDILERRKRESSSLFVFPGDGKTGHLVTPRKAWTALITRAGLPDLRLHDLRRTCGSYQAATGANQAVISKSLGHKNIATTAIYTRICLDPVRESMERAAKAMLSNAVRDEKIDTTSDE